MYKCLSVRFAIHLTMAVMHRTKTRRIVVKGKYVYGKILAAMSYLVTLMERDKIDALTLFGYPRSARRRRYRRETRINETMTLLSARGALLGIALFAKFILFGNRGESRLNMGGS
jgi:histidinol phosphatase-like PHP family hydrolase